MYEFLAYRVRDVMVHVPLTLPPTATLADAEGLFERHDFNGVPVLDGERLVGFVSKLDLLRAFAFGPETMVPPYEAIMQRPVATVMSRTPTTVRPDLPLTRLLALMLETRNKSFPVTEGDRLVGIVAREDVLRALREAAARMPAEA